MVTTTFRGARRSKELLFNNDAGLTVGTQVARGPPTPGVVDKAHAEGILTALKQQPPFDMLGDTILTALVASMQMRELVAGEVVEEEGQLGSVCYVIDRGELTVSSGDTVDTIRSGDVFGESAMLYDVRRVASLKAGTEASVWALHRHAFQQTVQAEMMRGRQELHAFLRGTQLFSRLGDRHLWKLADAVEDLQFAAGHTIIREGDAAEAMYIIKAGQCVVSQELETADCPDGSTKRDARLVTILRGGAYFGERALITQEPRSATVEAVGDVSVLRIDREASAPGCSNCNPSPRLNLTSTLSPTCTSTFTHPPTPTPSTRPSSSCSARSEKGLARRCPRTAAPCPTSGAPQKAVAP